MSVIIVSFNTRELTLTCLRSLRKHEPDAEVIVVDNASIDGSVDAIRAAFTDVTVIALTENIGFGCANNLGLKYASGRCIVLLNSDTELHNRALTTCQRELDADPAIGAITPRLRGVDGVEQATKHAVPSLSATLQRAVHGTALTPADNDFWIPGTCMVIRREAIETLGQLFEPTLFIYWEDADFCARMKRAGYTLKVADAEILHHGGASGGGPNCTAKSGLHAWYTYGRHIWYRRHRSSSEAFGLWLFELFDAFRCLARGIVRADRRHEFRYGITLLTTLARLAVGKRPSFGIVPRYARKDRDLIDARQSRISCGGRPVSFESTTTSPLVGIVVIGRNEGDRLQRCFSSLMFSERPIIYVDSGSSDGSVALAETLGVGVVSLDEAAGFSAARARNAGVRWLQENYPEVEYVQFLDGDCEINDRWIDVASHWLNENEHTAIACGHLRERQPEHSVFNRLCQMEWRRPVGRIAHCGGIFLGRMEAIASVDGFDGNLTAGEEPDLCRRLRTRGWQIESIDEAMASHDAAMTSIVQWWRRTTRAGYAAALLATRERLCLDKHYVKRTRSNIVWGGLLPTLTVVVGFCCSPIAFAIAGTLYLVLAARIERGMLNRGEDSADARIYALATVAGKLPQFAGTLRFFCSRALQSRRATAPKRANSAGKGLRFAWLTTEYPKASHTFVRREIVAMEAQGFHVERFSIRDAGPICDPADASERAKTTFLLSMNPIVHAFSFFAVALRSPYRFAIAAKCAVSLYRVSDRGWFRHFAYLVEATTLLRLLRQREISHVHVHFGKNAADVALLVRMLGGPTYSMQIHGPGEFDGPRSFSLGTKIHHSLFTAAITDYATAQLRRWSRYADWHKLHVVRCGVNDVFLNAESALKTDSRTLVAVGRLTAQKGQLLLIDALAEARSRGCDARLVLAGDGEMRSAIEDRIRAHQLEDVVTITGWIGESEVREYLLAARALVMASFAEGLPVAIMEALATGRPVISTCITGVPELVKPGVNGWLVTAGQTASLADAMCECLESPLAKINEMGRRGAALVRERHNAATETAKLAELLATSLSSTTSKSRSRRDDDRVLVGGVHFDRMTQQDALNRIDEMIRLERPGYFITANVNYLMLCDRNAELAAVNADAAFILADGMPIVWRSKLTSNPLPERVAGADLIYAISESAAEKNHKLFLLGAAEGVADRAAHTLRQRYPDLEIVGVESPPFRPLTDDEESSLIERIRHASPDILMVALGQPHGELWLHKTIERLGVPVAVQLGGSFNFVAGDVARCPAWLGRIGGEWIWRLACEPKKLATRYWQNLAFVLRRSPNAVALTKQPSAG